MNYPIWQVPAPGLLIALVSILHVFISHFAVGGGLFLVLTERRARQQNDALLLDYVRRLSRFFLLLTLVVAANSQPPPCPLCSGNTVASKKLQRRVQACSRCRLVLDSWPRRVFLPYLREPFR